MFVFYPYSLQFNTLFDAGSERRIQNFHGRVDLLFRHGNGRHDAQDHCLRAIDEQAFFKAFFVDLFTLDRKLDAGHERYTAYLADDGMFFLELMQLFEEVRAHQSRILQQFLLLYRLEWASPRRACGGRAAERRTVRAGAEGVGDFLFCDQGTDGKTAAEGFRERQHVGLDAEMLVAEHPPRPSHSRLDLVEDEEDILFGAHAAQGQEIFLIRHADAAFAVDRLQHDGDRLWRDSLFKGREVVERHVHESCGERIKTLLVFLLTGRRHGRERAPVEGALEGDDLVALRVPEFSRQLDGRFVGFRARVAEKDFSGKRVLDYLFRQYPLPFMVVVVGYVYQLGGLFPYSLDDARMTVPYPAYRPSGEKIKVLFSFLVPDFRPLAARKYERRFSVRRDDVCFVQIDDIFFVHPVRS